MARPAGEFDAERSEEHTSELQSLTNLVCRLLLEKKKKKKPESQKKQKHINGRNASTSRLLAHWLNPAIGLLAGPLHLWTRDCWCFFFFFKGTGPPETFPLSPPPPLSG